MSKISTYEVAPLPKLADKLIGTSVGGEIEDVTYNFTLQELLDVFLPVIPANNLQGVLDYGNTATQDINLFGTITTTNLDVTDTANLFITYLNEETHIVGSLFDSEDSIGLAGQVLTSTGEFVEWVTLPPIFTPNLQQVLDIGNTSDTGIILDAGLEALDVNTNTATINTNITIDGTITDGDGGVGVSNNVLSSTLTGVKWVALPVYSATSPLLFNSATGVFSIQQAASYQNGYLSSSDWITFDGKQNAGNYITALTGEATASGPGSATVTLSNAAVIGKVLTGFNPTVGTINASDSILTAFGKTQSQINALVGGVIYQGTWNASANVPTLTSSVGVQGHYYIVNVAGNTNLNGITDWKVGDWAIFSETTWQKVDNTESVSSVNGFTGAVSLTTDNIPEGTTNLYFLNSRARQALSFLPGSGAYDNTSGAITIPTNNNQILNGAGYIVLGSLSANSPLSYNNTTGAFSIQVANSSQNGYLSSTDWSTFNSKQGAITLTTTGTSGPSTLIGNTLNIPDYGGALTGYVPYTGATGAVNLGAYDLTVQTLTIGKGLNSLSNNTALGYRALFHITTGNYNTAVGYESSHNITTGQYNTTLGQSALFTNTTGSQNTAIGLNALLYNLTGGSNVVVGLDAMQHNTSGSSNTALGYNAGSHITGGSTPNTTASNSVYIGRDTKAKIDGGTNEIVIGNAVTGNGSNTVTIGNSSVIDNYFTGSIHGGSFIRLGGTSSQFLKANGSIDSNAYITLTSLSASAPLGYNNTTGAFTISQAGASTNGYLTSTDWNTFNSKQEVLSLTTTGSSGSSTLIGTTLNVPTYTLSGLGGVPSSRTLTINGTAYDLSADRSWSVGTVTSVAALTLGTTGTDLSSSVATGTTTPVITLNVPTASAANRGALSATDWSTFNTKVGSVTASSPLASSGGSTPNITIQQSSGSQDGYLSSTDWTTFNSKQAAGNYITSLTGEATASGPGAAAVTLNNASVTGKVLTGVNITGGTVVATDTMLTAFGKLQNQINALVGSSVYQGTWNASTNTPALASGVGTRGYYYIVSVAGTTNLDGITDWFVGDWAIFDGTAWQQVDNTDAVVSVNGQTGAVSLTTDNIPEGATNQYFLNSRARAALSFTAGSGAYNSTTGVITIPTNTNQLTNGALFITLASLSGAAPIQYNNNTGAISITQSGTASNGFLSSTDWNTFNNKQATITLTTTGSSGTATLIGTTLNIPNYGSALTAYVPYTGATTNLNLGNNDLYAKLLWITNAQTYYLNASTDSSGGYIQTYRTSDNTYHPTIIYGGSGGTLVKSLILNNTGATFNTGVTAESFTKSGGTASQFLKANGTIDSNTYALDSSVVHLAGTETITGSKTFTAFPTVSIAASGYNQKWNQGVGNAFIALQIGGVDKGYIEWGTNAARNGNGTEMVITNTVGKIQIADSTGTGIQVSGGNTLIGTTTDNGSKLQVNGAATFSSSVTATQGIFSLSTSGGAIGSVKNLTVTNTNGVVGDWAGLNFGYYNATTNFGYIGTVLTSDAGNSAADLVFGAKSGTSATSVTEYMRIKNGGNVGIGTISPNSVLNVVGNSSTNGLTIKSAGNGGTFPFRVTWSNGSDGSMFCVNDNGNVGIGTSSPATTLEILGANEGEYFRAGAGTISARSLSFSNYSIGGSVGLGHRINVQNGSGQLVLAIGGSDKMVVANSGIFLQRPSSGATLLQLSGSSAYGDTSTINLCDGRSYIQSTILTTANGATDIRFGTYNDIAIAERMRITSGGNVLIGTITGVSGGGTLQVNGNVNINGVFQINGVTIGGGGGSGVTGSGTTGIIPLWTSSSSLGNSLIKQNSSEIQIQNSATTGYLRIGGGNGAGNSRVYIESNGDNSYLDNFGDNTYKNFEIAVKNLKISTGGAHTATFTNGNVLSIGSETPAYATRLFVYHTNTTAYNPNSFNGSATLSTFQTGNATGTFSTIRFAGGGSHEGLFGTVQEASGIASFIWQSYNGANYGEIMRLTGSRNVLIGTTSDNGYKLQINGSLSLAYGYVTNFRGASSGGDVLFTNTGTLVAITGTISAVTMITSGGFFDTSDSRLKTLIEDNYLLKGIENIKPKLYIKNGKQEVGYYAQDLEKILPSAITKDDSGMLSLAYSQVHTAKIAVVEDKVTILEREVSELKTKLQKYEL